MQAKMCALFFHPAFLPEIKWISKSTFWYICVLLERYLGIDWPLSSHFASEVTTAYFVSEVVYCLLYCAEIQDAVLKSLYLKWIVAALADHLWQCCWHNFTEVLFSLAACRQGQRAAHDEPWGIKRLHYRCSPLGWAGNLGQKQECWSCPCQKPTVYGDCACAWAWSQQYLPLLIQSTKQPQPHI